MLNNMVNLTDDELAIIQTSLQMNLLSYKKYVKENGEDKLDYHTLETIKEMSKLYERLNKEYF